LNPRSNKKGHAIQAIVKNEKENERNDNNVICKRNITSKAGQLEEAGIEIPNELLFIMLLNSLPEEYENFSIAITGQYTLEILKAKLRRKRNRTIEMQKCLTARVTH